MPRGFVPARYLLHVLTLFIGAALIFDSGCGGGRGGSGTTGASTPNAGAVPAVGHVFVLVEENHPYESVIGNPRMPYTNMLTQKYAVAANYYANQHPSLPNYFVLTVGDPVTSGDSFHGTITADNVVRALTNAGKSWKMYADSLPSAGYIGRSVLPYAIEHNPFVFLSDVKDNPAQASNIVPFTQLANDIQNDTLPDYAMIVPNLVNDGHECAVPGCSDNHRLAHVDNWVQTNIGPLINSSAFQNSVLIYTWDESFKDDLANQGGHVATILIGPSVKSGYTSSTLYQHQSTLRLTMRLLGVSDYPGMAENAPDMSEFF
jgi:hypothetical protein